MRDTGEIKNAKLINELCVNDFARRADVVLVNGKLSAFEIKGDYDSLYRLDGQVETFSRFFESLTIVCSGKHTEGVLQKVPSSIGVWQVSSDQQLEIVRPARVKTNTDIDIWLSFLPVRILLPMALGRGLAVGSGNRADLLNSMRTLPVSEIRQEVLKFLKSPKRVPKRTCPTEAKQKLQRTDPVALQLQRIREFLSMIGSSAQQGTAMPRKTARESLIRQKSSSAVE